MRRNEREIKDLADILAVLNRCEVLRLGLCVDNKPYIVPMNFAYETDCGNVSIYLHCASEGRKMDMIKQNNKVCFETDCSYKTLEAENACNWAAEFESVIGEGEIAVIDGVEGKTKALDAIMVKYGFKGTPRYDSQALERVTVLRISVSSMTGKRKLGQKPPQV